jgi:hypothetical protein
MQWGTPYRKWVRDENRYSVFGLKRADGLSVVWIEKNGKDMIQFNKYSSLLQTVGATVEEAFKTMLQKLPTECWPEDMIEKIGKKE